MRYRQVNQIELLKRRLVVNMQKVGKVRSFSSVLQFIHRQTDRTATNRFRHQKHNQWGVQRNAQIDRALLGRNSASR